MYNRLYSQPQLNNFGLYRGVQGGGRPPLHVPPYEAGGGTQGGGSFNITSACTSLPQVRHSGVPRGGSSPLAPPWEFQNTKLKGNYV